MQIMKTRYIILALSLAGILFSCSKAPRNDVPAPDNQITITVSLPDEAVKGGAGEKTTLSWTWSATDKITVVGETTEIFTIKSGFTPKKAEFTGTAVKGSKFSIYYPSEEAKDADWSTQVQNGNDNLSHLYYAAALVDVDDYTKFSFSEDWAEEHGGSLSQIGVLKFVLAPPAGAASLTEVSISTEDALFYTGNGEAKANKLSLPLQNVNPAGELVTAWMATSWNEATIPAGTPYTVSVIADGKTYAQKLSKTTASVLKTGQVNVITLTDASRWKDDTPHYASGEGTSASPWIINTPAHLANVADDLLEGNTLYFKLGADIDLSGITWNSISCDGGKQIVLDGDGHTISKLGAPLFASLDGTVKNLILDAASITGTGTNTGAIANVIPSGATVTVTNIQIKNSSISGPGQTGGAIAESDGYLTISNVSVSKTDVSGTLCGGVVGFINHSGSIVSTMDNCSFTDGTVSATARYCGGLVGSVSKTSHVVSNSIVKDATITSTKDRVGGAFGQIAVGSSVVGCKVENVSVTGGDNTAGFVGVCYSSVSRSYVQGGSVTGTTKQIAGFTAYPENATITDCYAVTTVNGGALASVGGFLGLCKGGNTVTNCYEACTVNGTGTGVGAFIGYIDTAVTLINKCIAWDAARSFHGGVKTAGLDNNIENVYTGTEGTITAKAQAFGWSTDIWDFSGDQPKLK